MEGYKFTAVVAIGLSGNALVELSSKENWQQGATDYLGLVGDDADHDLDEWLDGIKPENDVPGLYRLDVLATAFRQDGEWAEYKLISQTPIHYDAG